MEDIEEVTAGGPYKSTCRFRYVFDIRDTAQWTQKAVKLPQSPL